MRNAFPINVLNAIKNLQEVCSVFCATANRLAVVVAENEFGRGIIGVIDGEKPRASRPRRTRPTARPFSAASATSSRPD